MVLFPSQLPQVAGDAQENKNVVFSVVRSGIHTTEYDKTFATVELLS